MLESLTTLERRILDYLVEYLRENTYQPSVREIGRRFGNRDHTTVLHAIRKIDKEIGDNPHLKEEIEELKRQLNR